MRLEFTLSGALVLCMLCGCTPQSLADRHAPTSERNKAMHNETSELARKLTSRAYGEFFVLPAHEQTIERVWAEPGNHQSLERLAIDAAQSLEARFLACEVLFTRDFTFVSRVPAAAVAEVYANALAHNLTGMANSWGLLYEHADAGPVGIRFIMLGEAAVPALSRLLDDDSSPVVYAGSKEATVGNAYHYRVKDFAAYYLGRIRRVPVTFHREIAQRDREIALLREKLAKSRIEGAGE